MKSTGIIRRIDELGRVAIPKEIRRMYGINEGDPLEIYADKKGIIELRKYNPNVEEDSDPAPTEKTIRIYINNETGETINEDRANDIISQYAMIKRKDAEVQSDFLTDLIQNGNDSDILWMIYDEGLESCEARKRYFEEFHEYCRDIASDKFNDEYTEHTITIPC